MLFSLYLSISPYVICIFRVKILMNNFDKGVLFSSQLLEGGTLKHIKIIEFEF